MAVSKAGYRIIDANFNRAREALRVMEEYCRFVLNHQGLTGQVKEVRHALCAAIMHVDNALLLACRDTTGDVGTDLRVQGQLQRQSLEDCLAAACKRLPEALRAMAEVIQCQDPTLAQAIEGLRYRAYTLEKDIALVAVPAIRFRAVRLYVILSTDLPADALTVAYRCTAGGADAIQLRCKVLPDRQRMALGQEFAALCREAGVLSIVNDRIDLAVVCGADGVHLGRDDLPCACARQVQTQPLIVGLTTHNSVELKAACGEGPTYCAIGPAFSTQTKPDLAPAGLSCVRKAIADLDQAGIGHVVIGGITLDNLSQVLDAGARTIAVGSAITEAKDPADACTRFKAALERY